MAVPEMYSSTNGKGGTGNPYAWRNFGNYNLNFLDWGPDAGTLTQWIVSESCWGVSTTTSAETGGIKSYPSVVRGWSNNDGLMSTLSTKGSYPLAPDWTTRSGMGVRLSALRKCHVGWDIAVPERPNENNGVSRWNALIDVYFHSVANPPTGSGGWLPQVDLQIMQMLMDAPIGHQSARTSGYFALSLAGHNGFTKTIAGVTYVGAIDMAAFNRTGGHTITLMAGPTMFSNPRTTGLRWGQPAVVHDVGAIIAWLEAANPTDDSGNPVKTASGRDVVDPLVPPELYLTAVNAGFEIDFGSAPEDNHWTTRDFWVAMQDEPDGR